MYSKSLFIAKFLKTSGDQKLPETKKNGMIMLNKRLVFLKPSSS